MAGAAAGAEDAPGRAAPRDSRFGSRSQLSKVHWVRPELVVEVTYLTGTEDNLLRQVSYQGHKPARTVVGSFPIRAEDKKSPPSDFADATNARVSALGKWVRLD